jgi:hypothetical protein
MRHRVYDLAETTELWDLLRSEPPWWVHFGVFGIIGALLLAGSLLATDATMFSAGSPKSKRALTAPPVGR